MKTEFDFLIIGQGIAGTCLAIELQRAGKTAHLVNSTQHLSSSSVAAGLMHPVTGRRIVKTWRCDDVFPFASSFYMRCEQESGVRFYHPMDCLEMVSSVKSLNDWIARTGDVSMKAYLAEIPEDVKRGYLTDYQGLFRIANGGWLNLPLFLEHYRSKWKDQDLFTEDVFDEEDIVATEEHMTWKGIQFKGIVYCQGFHAFGSSLWGWLPFESSKGEVLTVHIPDLPQEDILVNGIFLIPLGDELFRVGSTYDRMNLNWQITEDARNELTEKLAQTIRLPFQVVDQKAGIRPAAKDRKPVLGTHPLKGNFHLFNGLGSKGSSLAPFLAHHLTSYLVHGTPLFPEVDIRSHWK